MAADPKLPRDLGPKDHQGSRKVVQPHSDGNIQLHARDASVHGTTIRFEPQPEKDTIGYWSKVNDWVSWKFALPKPGAYSVEVLQGCGKGNGGSEVEITVGDQAPLPMTVEDTGHFQKFIPRGVGSINLGAGEHTLAIRAKTKKAGAVMDVRQVTLKPVTAVDSP